MTAASQPGSAIEAMGFSFCHGDGSCMNKEIDE
jgi:hypothetical protein